ncbi:MAG: M48 family peptidase [Clostridia bacterium]|nr:M48 family peptidase [Clostridia bacterium]
MLDQASIIREKRKSIKITISNDGKLIVYCPFGLPYEKIIEVLHSKENLLKKRITKTKDISMQFSNILENKSVLLFGKEYEIIVTNKVKKPCFTDEKFLITQRVFEGNKTSFYIKKVEKEIAERVFVKRIRDILQNYDYNVSKIIIGNFKSKWGSCDNFNTIKLNWRLVMLPPKLVDFVIFHELTHLLELNHSKRFYYELEKVCTTWKESRQNLRNFNFLLSLYN